jgi:carboxyl-terminal processing protease
MIRRSAFAATLLLAVVFPAALVLRADVTPEAAKLAATDLPEAARTNRLAPGPGDGEIAYVTAKLLEQNHFLQHPFDNEFSGKFFERYIELLDPQRLHFTQADLDQFASYRTNLDNLTFAKRRGADTTPAYNIFNRFRERLEQRVAYALDLLKTEKFTFDTDERITVNRRDADPPADLAEARQLWRQRLRSEYLQEKLAKYAAKKKAERTKATAKADESASPEAKEKPKKTDDEEIVETLTRRYTRNAHFYRELENDDVLEYYLTSLAHAYDPHSDYFNPRQAENFAIGMNLSLYGIGAVLTTDMDGYCKIQDLKPGPAMNSGKVKLGDRIVAVAQSNAAPVDVVEMNLNKIVQMVRGPKGSEVRLTLVSSDSTADRREVALIRDEIKLDDQAAKAKVIDLPMAEGRTLRVGVIDLPSFYTPIDIGPPRKPDLATGDSARGSAHYTSTDVAKLLTKLKAENVQGIVLDLRRNGGGSLEECVKLTGLFIKDGPVVQVAGPPQKPPVPPAIDEDSDPSVLYDGPLVILTSRYSASASEILAGALQDYGRALIVGDLATHGKGTVQQLNPLRYFMDQNRNVTNDPGTLKITKAKFYRPSGASTQKKGVMSDIVLPSKLNFAKDIGEESIPNALKWDPIDSAKYDKLNLVEPFLQELLRRSNTRLATNQDFAYVREDIELFKKFQAENSLSLNEAERIQEWERDDARQRQQDKERLARKTAEPAVYELTLKQVDLPGLPPPVAKTNAVAKVTDPHTNVTVDSDDAEETPPAVDAGLEETQRILVDYIWLLSQKGLATTAGPRKPLAQ